MKDFLCSYRMGGDAWSFEIKAKDFPDAERRLGAIKNNGNVDGPISVKIRVPGTTRFWVGVLRFFGWGIQ